MDLIKSSNYTCIHCTYFTRVDCKCMLLSSVQCPWRTQQHHSIPSCYKIAIGAIGRRPFGQIAPGNINSLLEPFKLNTFIYTYMPLINGNQYILLIMSICICMYDVDICLKNILFSKSSTKGIIFLYIHDIVQLTNNIFN